MYPKTHPAGSPDHRQSMECKKQQKREQLAALLINKFRNKYRINLASEKDLDDLVQKAVSDMIRKENTMCEKNLRELDSRIATQVELTRGGAP
jgi:DNA-directed RNA polymerase specialized sigma24 family protein